MYPHRWYQLSTLAVIWRCGLGLVITRPLRGWHSLLPAGAADTPHLGGSAQWEPQDWSPGLHDLRTCGINEQSWQGTSGEVMTSVFSFLGEKKGDESGGVMCVCVCMIILVIGHKQRTVVFIKHRVHGCSYVLGAPGGRWKNHKRFSPGMTAMWVISWWKSSWWIP